MHDKTDLRIPSVLSNNKLQDNCLDRADDNMFTLSRIQIN